MLGLRNHKNCAVAKSASRKLCKRFVGSADLPHLFVPDIGDALFGNQPRLVGHGFVFGTGNALANPASDAGRRKNVGERLGDFVHEGIGVGPGTPGREWIGCGRRGR